MENGKEGQIALINYLHLIIRCCCVGFFFFSRPFLAYKGEHVFHIIEFQFRQINQFFNRTVKILQKTARLQIDEKHLMPLRIVVF